MALTTEETLNELIGDSSTSTSGDDGNTGDRVIDSTEADQTIGDKAPTGADTGVTDDTNTDGNTSGDSDDGEGDDVKDADGKPLPFHKHPRWQEREKELKELRDRTSRLEIENDILKSTAATPKTPTPAPKPAYIDITQMKPDELEKALRDDPASLLANMYLQVRTEVLSDIQATTATQTREQKVNETFRTFASEHPDFDDKWKSGETKKFMDDHPGHNAISAYLLMTMDSRIQEEKSKAAKEAEKKALANQKAKRTATTLSGNSSSVPQGDGDEELKDTKKSGGLTQALTQRLINMRRSAGK